MKVFVTGGSGFVGGRLLERSVNQRHTRRIKGAGPRQRHRVCGAALGEFSEANRRHPGDSDVGDALARSGPQPIARSHSREAHGKTPVPKMFSRITSGGKS